MLDKHMSAGQKRSPQTPIRKRVLVSTQRYELAQAESNDDDNGSGTQQYLTASTCPTLSTKNGAITVNSSLEMPEDPLDNGACGKERISYDSLTNLYEGNLISSTKIAEEIIRDEITFRPASLIDAEAYRTIDSFIEDAYCAASNVGRLKFWMIFIVLVSEKFTFLMFVVCCSIRKFIT